MDVLYQMQVVDRAEGPSCGLNLVGGGLCSQNVTLDVKQHAEVMQKKPMEMNEKQHFTPF